MAQGDSGRAGINTTDTLFKSGYTQDIYAKLKSLDLKELEKLYNYCYKAQSISIQDVSLFEQKQYGIRLTKENAKLKLSPSVALALAPDLFSVIALAAALTLTSISTPSLRVLSIYDQEAKQTDEVFYFYPAVRQAVADYLKHTKDTSILQAKLSARL